MSARDPLDRYYTPPEFAEACVRWLRDHWLRERWGGPDGAQYAFGDPGGTMLAVWRPATMHRPYSRIRTLGQWRTPGGSDR